jgi:5'-nucleotidase
MGARKVFLVILQIFVLLKCLATEELFPLSIIHLNDMHARFDETNMLANTCKDPSECIGGYARVVSTVRKLRSSLRNSVYLNVADNFQGTLWYNMFRWNATQYFLNIEAADATVSFALKLSSPLPYLIFLARRLAIMNSTMALMDWCRS